MYTHRDRSGPYHGVVRDEVKYHVPKAMTRKNAPNPPASVLGLSCMAIQSLRTMSGAGYTSSPPFHF